MNAWGLYTHTYERYALLNEMLVDSSADVRNHFWGSLERYIQEERFYLLDKHWGGIENATPAQADEVTVPPETLQRLQRIIGFYGVNRCFLFLYTHAFLWDKVMGTGPLGVIEAMLDELDPR